jgi:outer membrane protein
MKSLALSLALALFAFPSLAAAQELKIGVVDFQRAMREVDEGTAAQKALKKEFDEKQKTLDDKQNELKALKDELDARGAMMKPEVKQAKVEELQKKLYETQQLYMSLQGELSKREAEAAQEILKKMGVIVQTMGAEQGFTLIVDRTAVLYTKEALDLTNELIRRYNESYGKKKK